MTSEQLGTFEDDIDKLYDLLIINKEEFLQTYQYIHEQDYINTFDMFYIYQNGTEEENESIIQNVVKLFFIAESMHLDELNGRIHNWNVTGEQLKKAICGHVEGTFNKEQKEKFYELIK